LCHSEPKAKNLGVISRTQILRLLRFLRMTRHRPYSPSVTVALRGWWVPLGCTHPLGWADRGVCPYVGLGEKRPMGVSFFME